MASKSGKLYNHCLRLLARSPPVVSSEANPPLLFDPSICNSSTRRANYGVVFFWILRDSLHDPLSCTKTPPILPPLSIQSNRSDSRSCCFYCFLSEFPIFTENSPFHLVAHSHNISGLNMQHTWCFVVFCVLYHPCTPIFSVCSPAFSTPVSWKSWGYFTQFFCASRGFGKFGSFLCSTISLSSKGPT